MKKERNEIVVNLLRISAYLMREGNRVAAQFGLNQQQFVVLNYIMHHQSVSQQQICSGMVFEKSNISKIIRKLTDLGFISIMPDRHDRRSQLIEITELGRNTVAEGNRQFNTFNDELLGRFTDAQLMTMLSGTTLLNEAIRTKT